MQRLMRYFYSVIFELANNMSMKLEPHSGMTFLTQTLESQVRNWIMPINRKYNIGLLLQTLREELRFKNNYKVLFEYVMLAGVNDR